MPIDGQLPMLTRTFVVDGVEVGCSFFQPEPDRGDYCCTYEIAWPEGPRRRTIYGVDPIQAVLLAMQMAHVDLLVARKDDGRDVRWLDGCRLGLPIQDSLKDLDVD
jgi:hypothetical protein